ncbi:MAG TPA: hypothetical protein VFG95_09985, partial [Nitrospiria bacterium]|nr:hypothetical protein [Nitrospiria bacterium]
MKKAGSRGLRKISRKRTGARPKPAAKALHPGSSAKFSPPRLSRVFHRKRLYRLLDQIRPHRIIWIVSLPGSGKTSLVGGYFAFRRLRSLWYQVDALDADPATFFHNFQTAVRLIRPKAPPLPGYTPDVQADPVRFARQFFRALYRNWRGPRLVFDDYHELPPDSVVHALLRVACEELPVDGLCLFISRVDPPAELVRLRANESMALIGWRELQLTVDETAGIAGLRRPLPKDEVAHLHARTDGWAAGLVLCLEQSGRDRSPNPAGAVTPQAVFDYFAAEILADVGPATRRAVLEASIPPYVTVDLLRQMGLPAAAIEALDLLYRRNAFVTRRSSPEGYDLHPLFREYLRQRAVVELGADRCSGLRRHAAVALAAAGEIDDAADLFRATGAWEELASLVLRDATVWLAQGRYRRLEEWILTVPESIRDRVPWLRYWLAVTRLPFDYGQAQRDMEGAWEGFEQFGDWIGSLLAAAGVLDALFNQFSNFFRADAWIARVERLLAQQSAPLQREIEGIVMAALCKAAVFRCPEHPNLRAWVARLHELAQEERDPSRYISYCLPLLLHYGHVGNFDRAAELLPNLRKSAVAPTVPPLLQALAYMCEAIHGWLTGRREIARRAITVGTTLSETHGVVGADNTIQAQGVYNALP